MACSRMGAPSAHARARHPFATAAQNKCWTTHARSTPHESVPRLTRSCVSHPAEKVQAGTRGEVESRDGARVLRDERNCLRCAENTPAAAMPTADENPSCREIDGDETVRRGRIEPLHDGRRESESTRPDLARLDRGCNTHALSSLATDVCRAVGLAVGGIPAATAGR